jgi:predicted dienelactone hydrolase
MSLRKAVFAAALLAAGVIAPQALAENAGFMALKANRPDGPPIEVGLWYPTKAAPAPMSLGSWSQTVAPGAPIAGDHLPLVVMSHGNGGFFGSHIDTAQALAEAGFIVAAPTHPGDNFRDQSRSTALSERPAVLSQVIDWVLTASPLKAAVDPARIGAFGFSAGGFTVLVAAGGAPDLSTVAGHCKASPEAFDCALLSRYPIPPEAKAAAWTHDPRIKAVVSAAPALGYAFTKEGLSRLTVPLQLWNGAEDAILPGEAYAVAVHRNLGRPHDYRLVAKAGHFDFLPPCEGAPPAHLAHLCASQPGFDRTAFHRDFNSAVTRFFTDQLVALSKGAPKG